MAPVIAQPVALATPALAVKVSPLVPVPAQASVAPVPGSVPMASVIEAAELVATLPEASSTLALGSVPQAAPSTPPPGWVLKTSSLAAPKVMEKALLVPVVNPLAAAVRV